MDDNSSERAVLDALRDLSAEATVQRRTLELLADRAMDHGDPVDYSVDIGGLSKQVAALTERITALKDTPAFAKNGERFVNIIENATSRSSGDTLRKLSESIRSVDEIARAIKQAQRSERNLREQDDKVKLYSWGGLSLGAFIVALLWIFWSVISGPTDSDILWLQSREGRDAQTLAKLHDPLFFLECRGINWSVATTESGRKVCVGDGKHGWYIP